MTATGAEHGDAAMALGPSHGDNFHLLRLVFASLVAGYHMLWLSGVEAWAPLIPAAALAAEIGVQGFFIVSGYLVAGSLERSATLGVYAEKRVRRLYPAYATVIICCAIAALAASPAARDDFGAVLGYLGWNLVFLNFMQPELPGLFQDNPIQVVNGALWTLKIEVMFYIALPVLAQALRAADRWRWAVIALIYVCAEAWRMGLRDLGQGDVTSLVHLLSHQLPGQMSFFVTGVALYLLRERISRFWGAAPLGAALLAASVIWPEAEPLRAAGLGLLAIWFAIGAGFGLNAARFGDFSYGVYIVHFPVVQGLTMAGVFALSPWIGAAGAVVLTLTLAMLLWRLVERPFLRADSAYRRKGGAGSLDPVGNAPPT